MKKIVLSLAGVLAATAFAPEASAVPAFARQTGMACSACHFQSFPALTGFGKSFKTSGYTMVGAQGKIEGEHGLSIPDTLNLGIYMQARYKKTNGPAAVAPIFNTNNGRFDVPDEFSLFAGGRVSENIGSLLELSLTAGTPAGATGVAGFKLPVMFDMNGVKVGAVPFTVGGLGPQYGFDLFATGSTANGRVIENGLGYSASMYLGTNGNATGVALVAANETFHASVTPWAEGANVSNGGGAATKLGATYVRLGWTPTYENWDLGFGVQNYSGNGMSGVSTIPLGTTRNSATVLDFQGQGEVAGMPVGIYGSYGWAGGQAAGAINAYNAGPERKSAFGLLADVGVIPNTLNVEVGFMRAKTGANVGLLLGTNESDNSYTLGLRYKLAQNVKLGMAYTKSSGSAYLPGGTNPNAGNGAGTGDSLLNFIFSVGY